jgi:Uma2 family endonuclease
MLKYQWLPTEDLPSPDELPDNDGKPVDNDLQYLIPTLLRDSLHLYWHGRQDWFFGVNMGVYHNTPGFNSRIPIVPDGFLSLGVPSYRDHDPKGRLSYVVWHEQNIVPVFVLECVSQTYGGEYDDKLTTYAQMGVLYYAIYNPHHYQRRKRAPFEVYHLVQGAYERLFGPRIWLPRLGLSLGRELGTFHRWKREWLYWYDSYGQRLHTSSEWATEEQQRAETEHERAETEHERAETERKRAETERKRAETERERAEQAEQALAAEQARTLLAEQAVAVERQRTEKLAAWLRQQGIDPDPL